MKVIIGNATTSDKQRQIEEMALALLDDMAIHEVFHILRRRVEINQADIAKETKIQSVLLSMFERGTIILPEDDIEKLLNKIKEIIELKKVKHLSYE